MRIEHPPAPGARLEIRGEEWVVRRSDRTYDGHYVLSVTGLSPLVRDRDWEFLTELDPFTEVDPRDTKLAHDATPGYAAAKLHIESLLRATPPVDEFLYVGHRGAMDDVRYQRLPAIQALALEQPRPRILIADGTGLGKTLEAGILIAELMRRGRGRRILVVTLKSMLTQFQKELWSRFTIPLVRLDSAGIQRVRNQIPVGHNPFNHFDKSIISIDTLKSAGDYRVFIEQSYWDIIVVDEAQNVAQRGTRTLRNQLAELLADRSDALIMLSATPHDGSARSFASLMRMLDPTAIANPNSYTKEDLQGRNLFVRRFKKDVCDEVATAFRERETHTMPARASAAEEAVYAALADTSNEQLSTRVGAGWLLRTVLEKAVLSSPQACLETVRNRIEKLRKQDVETASTVPLERVAARLEEMGPGDFTKYGLLIRTLHEWSWSGTDAHDRVVIFTERIATLDFLHENLARDLELKPEAIQMLKGTHSDVQQQEVVEAFGSDRSPVRLLLSTDVGSEGINLHYHCRRLIHFDIPWSLMVLQQRNGRIDRYGQERRPEIVYLLTESENSKFKDDRRILQILIRKEEQAQRNIGDPASLMGLFDVDKEVRRVGEVIDQQMGSESAEAYLFQNEGVEAEPIDFLAALLDDAPQTVDQEADKTRSAPSLYASDYDYLKAALMHAQGGHEAGGALDFELKSWDSEARLQITAPAAMSGMLETLPVEARPKKCIFDLTASAQVMMREIKACRAAETTWPRLHYLWPLHPLMDWATDKVRTSFRRMEAPIIVLPRMPQGAVSYVISVSFPNRKGSTVFQEWYVVQTEENECIDVISFEASKEFTALRARGLTNAGCEKGVIEAALRFLPEAVEWAECLIDDERKAFVSRRQPDLEKHLQRLKDLEARHETHVGEKYAAEDQLTVGRKESELRKVASKFDAYRTWIKHTMHIEEQPFVQVVAVLAGP